jgi:hypothetical protein
MNSTPIVVQYLYVHEPEEGFYYPSVRAANSAAQVAQRYLECALTQVASLAYRDVDCELVLATNVTERSLVGRRGAALLEHIEALGARVVHTPYEHRPREGTTTYVSSRYVLDAILTAAEGLDPARRLWLTDLDCVWAEPSAVFAAAPADEEVGCIYIEYPPDWDTVGFDAYGRTRNGIGELAREMGADVQTPPWVGGELLTGTVATLRRLVSSCEQLDAQLAGEGKGLPTEEQILSLAGALGTIRFVDLSAVARRITTGKRSQALPVGEAASLGLWHLPAEKGLSMRRTAGQVLSGHTAALQRDLADQKRRARRFNVADTGPLRRLRDDSWIATQKLRSIHPRLAAF